jgi:hypothetical protein
MNIPNFIDKLFPKESKAFHSRLSRMVTGLLLSTSASTTQIAKAIQRIFGIQFEAAVRSIERLLKDNVFQFSDCLWRQYINAVLSHCEEANLLDSNNFLLINVDITSIEDKITVITASVTINQEKSIMLYISTRNYPKKSGRLNQKKMEKAFFNELRHLLPRKWRYAIVADRGFGHQRIIQLCEKHGFYYALRRTDDIKVVINDKKVSLQDLNDKQGDFKAYVPAWKGEYHFFTYSQTTEKEGKTESSTWHIISNLGEAMTKVVYEKRFKIEKLFQDWKSNGFNLEKTKLRGSKEIKRLIFFVGLSHAIASFFGYYLRDVKKKVSRYRMRLYSLFRIGLDTLQCHLGVFRNFIKLFVAGNKGAGRAAPW